MLQVIFFIHQTILYYIYYFTIYTIIYIYTYIIYTIFTIYTILLYILFTDRFSWNVARKFIKLRIGFDNKLVCLVLIYLSVYNFEFF